MATFDNDIEIEYTATIYIDNTRIKKRLRKLNWVNGNWDKYQETGYLPSQQPLCQKLPEWAKATYYDTLEMDNFSTTIEVCADSTLELYTRIRKVIKLICKPEVQS